RSPWFHRHHRPIGRVARGKAHRRWEDVRRLASRPRASATLSRFDLRPPASSDLVSFVSQRAGGPDPGWSDWTDRSARTPLARVARRWNARPRTDHLI